jgi:hypothetical protein
MVSVLYPTMGVVRCKSKADALKLETKLNNVLRRHENSMKRKKKK